MKILTGSSLFIERGNDKDYLIFSNTPIERAMGEDLHIVSTNFENISDKDGFYLIMTFIFYQELNLRYELGVDGIDYFKKYYDENIIRLQELLETTKELYINFDYRIWWFEGAENYLNHGTTDITVEYVSQISQLKAQKRQEFINSPDYDNILRHKREKQCFSVINRGTLWYESLTNNQKQELQDWYNAWLNVTETKVIPEKLGWL